MATPLRVLVVEDSIDDTDLLLRELRRGGYEVTHERVDTAEALETALDRQTWDIAFGDYSMPHFNGVAALKLIRKKGIDVPFIFVSGTIGENKAVEAMKNGASDYIMKGNLKRLVPAVERELREAQTRRERNQSSEALKEGAERLRMAINAARMYTWDWDIQTGRVIRSGHHQEVYGSDLAVSESDYASFLRNVHPEDREKVEQAVDRAVQGEVPYRIDFRIVRSDGDIRWLETQGEAYRNGTGKVTRIIGVTQDITERKQAEQALRDAETRYRLTARATNDVIWDWDLITNKIEWNEGVRIIFGYPPDQLAPDATWWAERIHPEDKERVMSLLGDAIESDEEVWTDDYRFRCQNGAYAVVIDRGYIVRDKDGKAVRMVGSMMDITARKQAQETIQRLAFYDALTDLPNRNNLIERLLKAIQADSGAGAPVSLMIMDLDHFKEINDTLGHHRGDLLLKEVGSRLKSVLYEPDVVARLGGDEFGILLPKMAKVEDIHVVIQKIQNTLQPPFMIEGLPIAVEASIGVALYPEHGGNPDSLLQRADVAMYAAKKSGAGYLLYTPTLDRHSPQRLGLMAELRQAIEQNQLLLHYQPEISLKEKRIFGVEALVRWRHPQRGMIPPDQFIAPAEQTGLIHPLTHWVLRAAMGQRAAWRQAGFEITVSINLSARNLLDPKLPETVAELLRTCDVTADQIRFEITESAIMTDPTRAQETLVKLHGLGIRFLIDDFGVGYSSLSYLQKLPVDTIKVDKSFVIHMTQNKGDAKIVHSTIELAHNLGLEVVAEGVETQEILDWLTEMGCDAAQGYFISRPFPGEDLTRWLRESSWGLKKK